MAWMTWDHYRHSPAWHRTDQDPVKRFASTVDVMFYASAAALAVAVLAILVN